MSKLPNHVVEEDRRLDTAASKASEELGRLRWHWTLDESNPERVGIREYARAVGRSEWAISTAARAFAEWSVSDVTNTRSYADQVQLAGMSEDRRAATEAIANAKSVTVGTVAAHHRDLVRDTVDAAREAAERRNTTVADEIPRLAASHERMRKAKTTERFGKGEILARIELRATTARRALAEMLEEARTGELDEEMIALLTHTLDGLRALITLIDVAIGGAGEVDWDGELARIGGAS